MTNDAVRQKVYGPEHDRVLEIVQHHILELVPHPQLLPHLPALVAHQKFVAHLCVQ